MAGTNKLLSCLSAGGDKPYTKPEHLMLTLVKPHCMENTYFYVKDMLSDNITASEQQQEYTY